MSIKDEIINYLNEKYEEYNCVVEASDLIAMFYNKADSSYIYKIRKEFIKIIDEQNKNVLFNEEYDETEEDSYEVNFYDSDDGNEKIVDVTSFIPRTVEDVIKLGKVDMDIWDVDHFIINPWTVAMKGPDKLPITKTNIQVKVWFKRKLPKPITDTLKSFFDGLGDIKLNFKVNPIPKNSGYAGEIALYDAHFGKFAWGEETLSGNWDIDICRNAYLQGCEKSLQHMVNYNPEKIFYPFGNDFMHFENVWGKTPMSGHVLDIDGRLPKVAKSALNTVIESINMCRSIAPVELIWVPGNHDMHVSYWMTLALEAYYRNDKYVNIDSSPSDKKARLWGNLLVGWVHCAVGRKLNAGVNMLPQFWPELWGKSIYRELHVGHQHKKVTTKTTPIDTIGGTLVRQIPSLSSIDYWHSESLFVDAVPAGEALLWNYENGIEAHYTANIKPVY